MEGLLPRATIYAHCVLSMIGVKGGQVTSASGYVFSYEPGQSGTAPASALLFAWMLWCSPALLLSWLTTLSLHLGKDFPSSLSLCVPRQSRSARALYLQPLSSWLFSLSLQPLCTFIHSQDTMARKRGRPRRGSAWNAHKAQRRRKEQLERALALATSMLRKKARAEKLALLATIAESGAGCSREATTIKEGGGWNRGCVSHLYRGGRPVYGGPVDCRGAPRHRGDHREESKPNLVLDEEFPGCIVEEIPWPGNNSPTSHEMQATGAELNVDNIRSVRKAAGDDAKQREFEAGSDATVDLRNVPLNDVGGGLHGSLLRAEHLALVFELRGHMSDLEHRALLMGQRLDMLLDAYSNVPAQRKCPLCAQAFAIPAGSMWQTGDGDRSPGT
jgi:hypothetical protein